MTESFDIIIGGGSVAGLSFAAEAARRGLTVLVLEEHAEIGEPEKCDGLVSLRELRRYFPPASECIQSHVRRGIIHSPLGRTVTFDASRLEVVVIDRSKYDKQLAERADAWGAKIKRNSRVIGILEKDDRVKVNADSIYESSFYVDATGPAALLHNKAGFISAAKYEIEGDWFADGNVEVFIDQTLYPGFFAWVIPRGKGLAKVGVAGRGINSFKVLNSFLSSRNQKIVRRVAAPIYVGGSIPNFVSGRRIYVGESAGQVKPTTAGGITTSIAGGVMAARWVADSIMLHDPKLLAKYQIDWQSRFDKEFRIMRKLRKIYEGFSNGDIEKLLQSLSSPKVLQNLKSSDFDFHASSLLAAIGVRGLLRIAGTLVSVEAKQLLKSLI
jgi:geranylgeranyl reductase family protein